MRSTIRAIAAIALAVTLAAGAASAATATTTAARPARWKIAYIAGITMSGFGDAVALTPRDAWAVGSVVPVGPGHPTPLIRRWDGRSWSAVKLPSKYSHADLFAVAGVRPTDVWVFGQYRSRNPHTFALRWDGSWSQMGDWRTYGSITNAVVITQRDVWIFADFGTWHYNGHRWTSFTLPFALERASAVSGNDIWAVGLDNGTSSPVLARWHNGRWKSQPIPVIGSSPPGPNFGDVLALSDHDVWVVGGTVTTNGTPRALALHWNGATWRKTRVPVAADLGRVVSDGSGGLWAALSPSYGDTELVRYSGGSWQRVTLPGVKGKFTSAYVLTRVPRSGTVLAAGSLVWGGYPATDGLILEYSR